MHGVTIGDSTYVYVAGTIDSGIAAFELGADGSLTSIQNIPDDATLELSNVLHLTSATVGGNTYLYANAVTDDGISVFQIGANGTLTNVQNITDAGPLELDGSWGRTSVATVGSTSFLIASGQTDDGVSVFRIEANGTLTNTDNETDAGALELDGATDTAAVTVGGRTFVYVAGSTDSGISAFELSAGGTLANIQNVSDDLTLNLAGAWGLATATVDGTAYLIASGISDAGLSVFSINGSGQLTNTDNVEDSLTRGLNFPAHLTAFDLDGETFIVASSPVEHALTVFHLGADGKLADVTTVFDSLTTALLGGYSNGFAEVDGVPFLLGTGLSDSGVSTFDIGSGDDTLTGTGVADVLLGLGGNDSLDGAAGDDRMIGGSGDDTYAVGSAGDEVVEQTAGGTDTVRTALSYTLGANVENLVLLGTDPVDGTGNGLDNEMTGNDVANLLKGKGGRDHLFGLGGKDELQGNGGNDVIEGGRKGDEILGNKGRDVMSGQGGNDDFVFLKLKDSGTTNSTRDVVTDFKGKDDLVFTALDAVKGQAGNQDFVLDTGGGFEAGEIRFREVAAGVIVELNVDGDEQAELAVLLKNFTGTINQTDFEF